MTPNEIWATTTLIGALASAAIKEHLPSAPMLDGVSARTRWVVAGLFWLGSSAVGYVYGHHYADAADAMLREAERQRALGQQQLDAAERLLDPR